MRDEALYFTRIGTFIERADNTTRLLESRWRDPAAAASVCPRLRVGVLLRAMSAFEIFRRLYRDSVTPQRVTEMLLMRDDLPQGVHCALDELHPTSRRWPTAVGETCRRVGELHARFHFGRFEDFRAEGLPLVSRPLPGEAA